VKVTLEGIKAKILPDGRTTLCILDLENGYTIKGLSACVDPAEFDLNLGRKYAFDDAFKQIWALEGYLLAEKMYWERAIPVATNPLPKNSRLFKSLTKKPARSKA
jgi:Phage protein (N4 Gp49/phage Sf6 gene 66) family